MCGRKEFNQAFSLAILIQEINTNRKNQGWRPWGNNRSGESWWPLWEIISSNREILLYAQRKYMCVIFSNYDPARQDLWADSNRPWDFDHIIPQDWIY